MLSVPAASEVPSRVDDWLEALAGAPLPGRSLEEWRFTDLAGLRAVSPRLVSLAPDPADRPLPQGVDRLDQDAAGQVLEQVLATTASAGHWPVRLHRAASMAAAGRDPAVLALRVRGAVAEPLLLERHLAASGLAACRLVLVLEPGASLELLEVVRVGPDPAAAAAALSAITAVRLGAGASLRASLLAQGGTGASLLAHWLAVQDPGSRLALTTAVSGWDLARVEPRIVQSAGAAHTRLRGLQACDGSQITDTHSLVRFEGPEGCLDQVHKALAEGRGHSIFNGAVQVPRVAQRTRAAQLSRNLLLSDRARIDTKPELAIVADDVTCSHGATVSRLREDELFYLQSRGIGAAQAAVLLKRAFCQDVLRELPAAAAGWNPLDHLLGA